MTEESFGKGSAVSPWKKIIFSLAAIGTVLLALEGLSWTLLNKTSLVAKKTSVWTNPKAKGHQLIVPDELGEELNEPVVTQVTNIFLNRPDSKFIFRVREAGPEDTDLRKIGVNSLGFRGPEFDLFELPERRVLFVGDSCGFGWGIWNSANTIAGLLDGFLRADSDSTQVYNISQGGFSSFQCRLMFEEWYDRIKPQLIIFYLGWNDIHGTWIADRQASEILSRANVTSATWYRKSNIFKLGDGLAYTAKARLQEKKESERARTKRVPQDEAMENLRSMIERGLADGCRSIIIEPPFSHGISPLNEAVKGTKPVNLGVAMVEYREALEDAFADQKGIFLLKFTTIDHDRPEAQPLYQGDGYHPNEKGARMIAEGLHGVIRKLAVLPDPVKSP